MAEEKKKGLDWTHGGLMIGLAAFFDVCIILLMLATFGVGIVATWLIGFFALLSFCTWLAVLGELNFKRVGILLAPMGASILGLPGWTAAIWPMVARAIGKKALGQVAPGAEKLLNAKKK